MDMPDVIRAAGGLASLARSLDLHHTTVLRWKAVPPHRVRSVSGLTGIPPHELRPDLWDKPAADAAAANKAKPAPPGAEAA